MKAKIDFVTNSSTTSFVMLGYVVKKKEISNYEKLEKCPFMKGFQIYEGTEMGAPNNDSALVGKLLGEMNSEYEEFEQEEVDLKELVDKINQLKLNLGLPDNLKPKLISSIRSSLGGIECDLVL